MQTRRLGFTLVELLIVLSVIAVVAAVAIPLVLRVTVGAHEASAIASLRTIHDAQEIFRVSCGKGKLFAVSLPQLGAAETITRNLSDATIVLRSGYLITLTGAPAGDERDSCTGGPLTAHWYATAVPQLPGTTGHHGFATALADDIWQDTRGTPPPEPFQQTATISRLENGR